MQINANRGTKLQYTFQGGKNNETIYTPRIETPQQKGVIVINQK